MWKLHMNTLKKTLLAIAISSCSFCSLSISAQPVELDSVLMVVNEGVILSSDVTKLKATVLRNTKNTLPNEATLNQQILDQLVFEELQLQEANRLGIKIDDNMLEQGILSIAKERKITLSDLKKTLSKEKVSWAEYRQQIRKEMTLAEVRNALVRRRINILPQEVETLAKQLNTQNQKEVQYNISQIQLRLEEDSTKEEREAVLNKAKALVQVINSGKDFPTLAMSNSNGPRALEGGNWGWLTVDEMPTIFADKIGMNTKGAIIGPFRSGVGYHILKINDTKGLESVAVTEVKARHILIKPSIILSDAGAKKQLNDIIKQINSGQKTFEEMAKIHSADPGSAVKGGDLGWQTTDIYVPEFKNTLDTLAKGKISAPFKTTHGWHIAQVLDKRQTDQTDNTMKNRAYRLLFNRKFNEETQAWLQELRAGAYIEQVGKIDANN